MGVTQWLKLLARWITKRFKKSSIRRSSKILKRYYGEHCALLRIERATRGAIATYRIIPKTGDWDYLLTLDSLALIEAEMVGRINGADFVLRSHLDYRLPVLSHRVAVWRVYRSGITACIGCWDCDLEGFGQGVQVQIAPLRIFANTALRTVQIRPTKVLSWQQQLEMVDWVAILEGYARGYLRREHKVMATRRI